MALPILLPLGAICLPMPNGQIKRKTMNQSHTVLTANRDAKGSLGPNRVHFSVNNRKYSYLKLYQK